MKTKYFMKVKIVDTGKIIEQEIEKSPHFAVFVVKNEKTAILMAWQTITNFNIFRPNDASDRRLVSVHMVSSKEIFKVPN